MSGVNYDEDTLYNKVQGPNQEALKHSHEFGKEEKDDQKAQKEKDKILKDLLNRPARELVSPEELAEYEQKYGSFWKVRVKRGISSEFIFGVL
jgi:hypothetical protein